MLTMKFLISIILIVTVLASFGLAAVVPVDGSVWLSKPYTTGGYGLKAEVEPDNMLVNTNYAVDVYAKMPESIDHFALDFAYIGVSAFYSSDKTIGYFVPASASISDIEKEGVGWIMVGGVVSPAAAKYTPVKLGTFKLRSPAARTFDTQLVPSIQGTKGEMVLAESRNIRTRFVFNTVPVINDVPVDDLQPDPVIDTPVVGGNCLRAGDVVGTPNVDQMYCGNYGGGVQTWKVLIGSSGCAGLDSNCVTTGACQNNMCVTSEAASCGVQGTFDPNTRFVCDQDVWAKAGDADHDGLVSDMELLQLIDKWSLGTLVPLEQSDMILLSAIQFWVNP